MTTLLVRTHGRWDYLRKSLASIDLDLFDRKILSCDGVATSPVADDPDPPTDSIGEGWEVVTTGAERHGLTANLRQGWGLLAEGEEVFDTEDDFLIRDLPLSEMRKLLEGRPGLAQVVLERQPVNPSEMANGGLLGGDNIPTFTSHKGWREQSHLFSFNPHLRFHTRSVPAGVEREVTHHFLAQGYTFGFWGAQGDAPRCTHIGVESGMGSAGWVA